jgi:hypothetical protein
MAAQQRKCHPPKAPPILRCLLQPYPAIGRPAHMPRKIEHPDCHYHSFDPIALTNARFHLLCAVAEAIHCTGSGKGEHTALANLLRDIFGPLPFRSVNIHASCLTPAVLAIAEAISNESSFHRLPVLADALEQGGCANPEILGHCRGPGPHVLGCWVVDLVLGKN